MSGSIKTLLGNKTFCALPFIHEYRSLDGQQYLCCHNGNKKQNFVSSQDIIKIRTNILNGIPESRCQVCYDEEKSNSVSARIKETISLIKDADIKSTLESAIADPTKNTIVSYDIRFDNRCNLACVGCSSQDSSLWARFDGIYKKQSVNFDLDFFKIAQARKIYLAGGEPLINAKVFQLLSTIAEQDQQPEIVINSNIASIKSKFFNVLAKLKNLSVTVSFDGYGAVNEYHRWPLQWDKFLSNLKTLNEMKTYISWNTVIDSVSVWGIENMLEIENLTNYWDLKVLNKPQPLMLRNLPLTLKPQAQAKLESLQRSGFYQSDPIFRTRINLAMAELAAPGDEFLLNNYINHLDQQRKLNHENYIGVKLT